MTQSQTEDTLHPESDGAASANPILAEVTRGPLVESRHRAAVAVVDPTGEVILSAGDIEAPVYGRSAIKSLQAIPLVESGAADAFGLSDAEIALACASHKGEPRHVETVHGWLPRIGCSVEDLECGTHLPYDEKAMCSLLHGGGNADAAYNNCSGKHSGFLTLARHLGAPTKGYIRYEHPVQQRILGLLESMSGLDLGDAPRGADGCGIPVIAIPLGNIALAMARFAEPHDQPEARQAACARIRAAITAEPFMIGGTQSYCTKVITATAGRALVKIGAEGVYCGAIPELGLGLAIKVDDGAARAAESILGRLLLHLRVIEAGQSDLLTHALHNRAGLQTGEVRRPEDTPF